MPLPAVIFGDRASSLSKAAYTRLESTLRRDLGRTSDALVNDQLTRQGAFFRTAAALHRATQAAFITGKNAGMGSRLASPLTSAEQQRAQMMSDFQVAKLRAWLLSPDPLQRPGQQGVGPRLDMYAQSVHGAYQTGLAFGLLQAASQSKGVALLEDDPIWLWERSKAPGVASCLDCVAREARSLVTPYTMTELMAVGMPATGGTRCLTRCRCNVRLVDTFGDAMLTARAHRRAKSTSYHGVVDPKSVLGLPKNQVAKKP